jgi:lysophospholipase L1-like esterase
MHRLFACLILLATAIPVGAEETIQATPQCSAPAEALRLTQPLVRVANRLARRQPVTIVAIGSSSTAGVGASTLETTYPSRLEAELKARIPGAAIRVINHGVSGDEGRQMLARFETDVLGERPDLVLWQLGTNAIVRETDFAPTSPVISEGLKRIRATGADAILIDPQYAPKVLRHATADIMIDLIEEVAGTEQISVFQRFALMRYWNKSRDIPFETFLSSDLFHMNDWSYGCMAETLAKAIVAALPQKLVEEAPTTVSAMAARTVGQ